MRDWPPPSGIAYARPRPRRAGSNSAHGPSSKEPGGKAVAKAVSTRRDWWDGYFKITQRGSSVRTEVIAGLTTFMTMGYILFLNPAILSVPDRDGNTLPAAAVLTVTALAAGISTIAMGSYANYPFAIAAGLGLNAVVAFQLVGGNQLTWPEADHPCPRAHQVPNRRHGGSATSPEARHRRRHRTLHRDHWVRRRRLRDLDDDRGPSSAIGHRGRAQGVAGRRLHHRPPDRHLPLRTARERCAADRHPGVHRSCGHRERSVARW